MDITKKIGPWREVGKRLLVITIYSIIMALNYKSFVQAGDLFPGGFTGLTRLAQRCAQEFWGVTLPFAPINLVLNAIPAAVSFKLIGKRFTMYSCLAIVVSSIFTDLVPSVPVTEDILLICVFGGLINGFSISLCLQARITSGGTDFIAIALAERKNVNAWNYIFCGNVIMLMVAGALFGWDRALYSIIFQFASTQVIRMMDPDGRRVTLFIVTGREKAGGRVRPDPGHRHTAHPHRGRWPLQRGALRDDLFRGGQQPAPPPDPQGQTGRPPGLCKRDPHGEADGQLLSGPEGLNRRKTGGAAWLYQS